MNARTAATLAVLLSLPVSAAAQRCHVSRDVDQRLDASDLEGVLMDVGSGSLEVVGVDGTEIRVRGTVCASDEGLADDSRLILEPRRGAAWIETDLPDTGWHDEYARMDLRIEMPRTLAADIRDSSGGMVVGGIAAARIDDSSGGLEVYDVPGAVVIDDGSGEIRVRRVGSVEIEDGSGEIDVSDVDQGVLITDDGSGQIDIRHVTGDVRIDEDGSGSIEVVGVGGDFTVGRDGSGGIYYRDVQGHVSIPGGR